MNPENLKKLAKVVALNPHNKNSLRQTEALLAEGLIDEEKIRHLVRYRKELQEAAHEYYHYCETESYRAARYQREAEQVLGRDFWDDIDDKDRLGV